MSLNVARELAALGRMTVKELRDKYTEVFSEETNGPRSRNRELTLPARRNVPVRAKRWPHAATKLVV